MNSNTSWHWHIALSCTYKYYRSGCCWYPKTLRVNHLHRSDAEQTPCCRSFVLYVRSFDKCCLHHPRSVCSCCSSHDEATREGHHIGILLMLIFLFVATHRHLLHSFRLFLRFRLLQYRYHPNIISVCVYNLTFLIDLTLNVCLRLLRKMKAYTVL